MKPALAIKVITKPTAGPSRSGTVRLATRRMLTTASPSTTSHDDQPKLMNIIWAKKAPTGPQGLAGGRLGGSAAQPGGSAGSYPPRLRPKNKTARAKATRGADCKTLWRSD